MEERSHDQEFLQGGGDYVDLWSQPQVGCVCVCECVCECGVCVSVVCVFFAKPIHERFHQQKVLAIYGIVHVCTYYNTIDIIAPYL